MILIQRWFERLAGLWGRLSGQRKPAPQAPTADPDILADHSFHFRGAILDNLDRYFYYLKKMQASDPDAYGLMGQTGLHVFPIDKQLQIESREASLFRRWHPSFGGVLVHYTNCDPDDAETLHAKFIYIMKKHSAFEAHGASLYEMTIFYTDEVKDAPIIAKRYGMMMTCQIVVGPAGEITLLKTRGQDTITASHGRRGQRQFTIPRMHLDYPEFFKELGRRRNDSPQNIAAMMFNFVATAQEDAAMANARVMVNKGGAAAAFNINIKRTAYFFRDRETTALAVDGKRKRIFHIVRAHARNTKRYGVVDVKFHFRGIRHFDWNGYSVSVSVPGLHHEPLVTLEAASEDYDPALPIPSHMIDATEAGGRLAARLRK